jgi:hypothetical protein
MTMVLLIILTVILISLLVAYVKNWIDRTFMGLVGIATIISAIFAVAVFIKPLAEFPQKLKPANVRVPESTPTPPVTTPSRTPEPTLFPTITKGEKRLNQLKKLLNRDITTYPNKSNVTFVIDAAKTESGFSPENTLYHQLRSEKIYIINLFKEDQFKSMGFFQEIYNGNTEILKQADAFPKVDYILLGKLNYSFRKGTVDRDLVSCDINFSFKIINKNAEIIRSDSLNVTGPGFSEDTALERGLEILSETYSDRILKPMFHGRRL